MNTQQKIDQVLQLVERYRAASVRLINLGHASREKWQEAVSNEGQSYTELLDYLKRVIE